MASVVVGKPINGVTLTEMRGMDKCPKAESARSRVITTNAGPKPPVRTTFFPFFTAAFFYILPLPEVNMKIYI
jgi:hypothetical protein